MPKITNPIIRTIIPMAIILIAITMLIPSTLGVAMSEHTQNIRTEQGISNSDIVNYQNTSAPYQIAQIEMVDNILYAITFDAKFVKTEDGVNWVEIYDFKAEHSTANHSDSTALYYSEYWDAWFCSIGGLYLYGSWNNGITWSIVQKFAHNGYLFQNGIGESPTGTLYNGQYGTTSGGWGSTGYAYLNVSNDGGHTWAVETTIQCTHIHSVNVGHDGTIWVGYEYPTGTALNEVKKKVVGGSWQNSTSVVQYDTQPTSILRLNDRTIFGSDSTKAPAIVIYDGTNYRVSNERTWLVYDMDYADGVIYAFAQVPYNVNPSGNEVWVSTDNGESWYLVYSFIMSGTSYHHKMVAGAVCDGSPFVYLVYDTGELFRINHLQKGWDALQFGSKTVIDAEENYSSTVYLGNNDYDLSLYREPILNPIVEIYAVNLTNAVDNGGMEAYPTGWVSYPTGADFTSDTNFKTEGSKSLKINAAGSLISTVQLEWRWYPSPVTTPEVYIVSYDARKDAASDSFTMRTYFSYAGSAVPALSTLGARGVETFSDTWTTYTYQYEGDFPGSASQVKFMFEPWNLINRTCYLDNVQLFKFPSGSVVEFTPSKAYVYNTATQTANVMVSVDGTEHIYTGPYDNGELIDTIQLTGVYDQSLLLSAFGDGCVKFNVTGERYGFASDAVLVKEGLKTSLLGGHNASYYKVFGSKQIYTNAINTLDNSGAIYTRKSLVDTELGIVGMALDCSVETAVEMSWYSPLSKQAATWTASWDGYCEQTYTIYGLKANGSYDISMDGRMIESGTYADENGVLSFTYAGTGSTHIFEVEAGWLSESMNGMFSIIVPLMVVGMLVAVVTTAFGKFR